MASSCSGYESVWLNKLYGGLVICKVNFGVTFQGSRSYVSNDISYSSY